ncbi:hypothetical protein B0T24DRAFT_290470 [Lasiosphaeria ovina]|uniref:Uncharacterized protein n=1 Tax=Lasiosphaeria ovina TaxID=92902 RepID=A0AAE0N838_9PEZI|nr:hypothetical protein B0T24DRAFT_290470 [Lasiosphaeria ovina]
MDSESGSASGISKDASQAQGIATLASLMRELNTTVIRSIDLEQSKITPIKPSSSTRNGVQHESEYEFDDNIKSLFEVSKSPAITMVPTNPDWLPRITKQEAKPLNSIPTTDSLSSICTYLEQLVDVCPCPCTITENRGSSQNPPQSPQTDFNVYPTMPISIFSRRPYIPLFEIIGDWVGTSFSIRLQIYSTPELPKLLCSTTLSTGLKHISCFYKYFELRLSGFKTLEAIFRCSATETTFM